MLNEGHRRRERGADVVVGFVETHGRQRTAEQIGDLEVIPRKVVEPPRQRSSPRWTSTRSCGGGRELVLVDELAHTNAPGLAAREALAGRRRSSSPPASTSSRRSTSSTSSRSTTSSSGSPASANERRSPTTPSGPPTTSSSSTWRPRRCAAASPTATSTPPTRSTPPSATTSAPATCRRCASWRCCGSPTASTTRCRTTANATASRGRGRPASGSSSPSPAPRTPITSSVAPSRMAQRAKGDLIGVHVVADSGLASGNEAAAVESMAAQRRLLEELGGEYRRITSNDVAAALVDLARAENATQIVLGASARAALAGAVQRFGDQPRRPPVRSDRRARHLPPRRPDRRAASAGCPPCARSSPRCRRAASCGAGCSPPSACR